MLGDSQIDSFFAQIVKKVGETKGAKEPQEREEPRGVKTVKCSACSRVGKKVFIRETADGKKRFREDVWCPGTWNGKHIWDKHWQFIPSDSDIRGGTGMVFPDGGPHKEFRKDGKR